MVERRISVWQTALRGPLEVFDLPHPAGQWVPSGENLGHHPFISILDRPQVAEGRCGYAGSNKAFSVERDSVWKEQLLEPLPLFECRLHPEVGRARQNTFCKRQNALYVEFFELAGVTVDSSEREFFAQFLGVTVVGLDVDRTFEEERLVQAVELSWMALAARSAVAISSRTAALRAFQICRTDSLSSRM